MADPGARAIWMELSPSTPFELETSDD